jgi:hypothetical protein
MFLISRQILNMDKSFSSNLIAPCGMNCGICVAYLREKNKCPGCRNIDNRSKYCRKCIIKNCKVLKENKWKFCSSKCDRYPCTRLKNLDKRYKTKYGMSMIENLEFIKENGIIRFIRNEKKRWIKGNKVYCVHNRRFFE